ncbi:hypothetical protein Dimus_027946 [Dionaea muscipula]
MEVPGTSLPQISHKQRMQEAEITCKTCLLCVKATSKAKRLRCPRCHAEIPLQDINYLYATQGISNNRTKKERERSHTGYESSASNGSSLGATSSPSISLSSSGKRALICGVSYTNQRYELKGTINDVHLMKEFLLHQYGFPKHAIRVLAEEDEPETISPTRQHMEEGLKWLVEGCKPGDSLLFYFSGHGLRQRDLVYDELDGYDETICPLDFTTNGVILDNDINAMIIRPLIRGVKLHAIIDACHSGTVLDLQQVYNLKEGRWMDNSPPNGAKKGTSGGLAICFSACYDSQMAADTNVFTKTKMCGAMTYCFIDAVKSKANPSYLELLTSIEENISKAYKSRCINSKFLDRLFHRQFLQEPLLSSSETFDVQQTRFSL